MYLTLLILPGISSIVTGLLGRKLGVQGVHTISLIIISSTSILTLIAFYEVVLTGSPVYFTLSSWVVSDYLTADWAFIFDSLTCSILLAVVIVSTMVHYYSVDYIAGDPHNQRFFSYLSIFTFFILVLVTGDNFLVLFLGWEGIGVASYLLVGFWYTRIAANKAAIQAMTVNRIGDIFFTAGLFALFALVGNVEFITAFSLSPHSAELALTVVGLFFLLAAIGKSAQIGLHTWLPSAMEG